MNNKLRVKEKHELVPPEPVTMEDIDEALKKTKCSPGLVTERYVKWVNEFGSTWLSISEIDFTDVCYYLDKQKYINDVSFHNFNYLINLQKG